MNLGITRNASYGYDYIYNQSPYSTDKISVSFTDETGTKYLGSGAIERVNRRMKVIDHLVLSLRDGLDMVSLTEISGEKKGKIVEKLLANFLKNYQVECGALPESTLSSGSSSGCSPDSSEKQAEDKPEKQAEDEPEKQPEDEPEKQPEDEPEKQPEDKAENKQTVPPLEDIKNRNPIEKKSSLFSAPKMTIHTPEKKEKKENKKSESNPWTEFLSSKLFQGQNSTTTLGDVEITDCKED